MGISVTSRREVTEGREGRVPGRRPVPWLNSVTWELELLWSFFEKILRGPQMVTLTGNILLCYLFAMSIQHCLITISANRNSTGYKGDSLRSRLGLHQPKWPSNKNERYHPDIRVWSQQTKDQSNLSVKYPNTQFCSLPTVLYLYVKCSFPLSFWVHMQKALQHWSNRKTLGKWHLASESGIFVMSRMKW